MYLFLLSLCTSRLSPRGFSDVRYPNIRPLTCGAEPTYQRIRTSENTCWPISPPPPPGAMALLSKLCCSLHRLSHRLPDAVAILDIEIQSWPPSLPARPYPRLARFLFINNWIHCRSSPCSSDFMDLWPSPARCLFIGHRIHYLGPSSVISLAENCIVLPACMHLELTSRLDWTSHRPGHLLLYSINVFGAALKPWTPSYGASSLRHPMHAQSSTSSSPDGSRASQVRHHLVCRISPIQLAVFVMGTYAVIAGQ
jgi:hypothetical protein